MILIRILEGELLVVFSITFHPKAFSKVCLCLGDFINIVRLLMAAVSINRLERVIFDNYSKQNL